MCECTTRVAAAATRAARHTPRSWLGDSSARRSRDDCREWPHAARRVAVCGSLTSQATCRSKRPRLHALLLFGQGKLGSTSWCAVKRVYNACRGGGGESSGNCTPGPAPTLPRVLRRGQPVERVLQGRASCLRHGAHPGVRHPHVRARWAQQRCPAWGRSATPLHACKAHTEFCAVLSRGGPGAQLSYGPSLGRGRGDASAGHLHGKVCFDKGDVASAGGCGLEQGFAVPALSRGRLLGQTRALRNS